MSASRITGTAAVAVAVCFFRVGLAAWNEGAPRINGPRAYGATPGRQFLYAFPTVGSRGGLTFSVVSGKLPDGVALDARRGVLSGSVAAPGEHALTVRAENALGRAEKNFTLVVGENARALTPPMGWTSWSAFTTDIDQKLIAATAKALVEKGLAAHGYAYVNIDSCWQGQRNKKGSLALQPNERFPKMGQLVRDIHALGLKAGIYSTPMVHAWGSRDDRLLLGSTTYPLDPQFYHAHFGGCGKRSMETHDAAQFADWGFDWLKYDWSPTDVYHCRTMRAALDRTKRDIVLQVCTACQLSNATAFASCVQLARGNGDTKDEWANVSRYMNRADRWLKFVRPGFWYDLDMLAVGAMRIGRNENAVRSPRPGEAPDARLANRLTEDELASHFACWAIIPVPLFLSCDIAHIDDFTLKLVTNDDLVEINQDYPATPAVPTDEAGGKRRRWTRTLSDGRQVLGFFNLGEDVWSVSHRLPDALVAKDVLAKRELGRLSELTFSLKPHACKVFLLKETGK